MATKSFVATLDVGSMSCRLRDMDAKRQGETTVYSLRIESEKFERLREIAVAEHHTVAQKLRVVIERAIADHDEQAAA
jgi:predicted DNA-binding protein